MDSNSLLLATQAAQITLLKRHIARLTHQIHICDEYVNECRAIAERAGLTEEMLLRIQTRADELSLSSKEFSYREGDDSGSLMSNPVVAAQREQQVSQLLETFLMPLADAWVDTRLSGDTSYLPRAVSNVFESMAHQMNAAPGFFGNGDSYSPDQYVSYLKQRLLDDFDPSAGFGSGAPSGSASRRPAPAPSRAMRRPPASSPAAAVQQPPPPPPQTNPRIASRESGWVGAGSYDNNDTGWASLDAQPSPQRRASSRGGPSAPQSGYPNQPRQTAYRAAVPPARSAALRSRPEWQE